MAKEELLKENEELKKKIEELLDEIEHARQTNLKTLSLLNEVKKELRRADVQINSLKTENEEFKNKFAKIENNPIGAMLLKIYRYLREIKRRRLDG